MYDLQDNKFVLTLLALCLNFTAYIHPKDCNPPEYKSKKADAVTVALIPFALLIKWSVWNQLCLSIRTEQPPALRIRPPKLATPFLVSAALRMYLSLPETPARARQGQQPILTMVGNNATVSKIQEVMLQFCFPTTLEEIIASKLKPVMKIDKKRTKITREVYRVVTTECTFCQSPSHGSW